MTTLKSSTRPNNPSPKSRNKSLKKNNRLEMTTTVSSCINRRTGRSRRFCRRVRRRYVRILSPLMGLRTRNIFRKWKRPKLSYRMCLLGLLKRNFFITRLRVIWNRQCTIISSCDDEREGHVLGIKYVSVRA